jgi:hypothetical protein
MSSNDLIANETLEENEKDEVDESEEDNCPICLDKMNNNNHIVTSCGHHFHASCLIKHTLLCHNSCPCCRNIVISSLEEEEEEEHDAVPNNVLANVVDRQHAFDVILDNILRLRRHNFMSFRDRMYRDHMYDYYYTTNDYKVVGFLKRCISFADFEDIYVSHTRRNLIVLQNEPYFTIDNCNLIAQHVSYKTEVMCEKYWKKQCSEYWSEYYIRVGRGVILGMAVLATFIGINEAK